MARSGLWRFSAAATVALAIGIICFRWTALSEINVFNTNAPATLTPVATDITPSLTDERRQTPDSRGGLRPAPAEEIVLLPPTAAAVVPTSTAPDEDQAGETAADESLAESPAASNAPPAIEVLPTVTPEGVATPTRLLKNTAAVTVTVLLSVDANLDHWRFIAQAVAPAHASQRETGVPASATIGQAIHESNWGTSLLSRQASNYFGIKATNKPGTKGVIKMPTSEHIGGADVKVVASFRAYNNMAESFLDHGRFFLENGRYARAMAVVRDPRAFTRLIADAGYATDPMYTSKVLAYMDKYNLYQYDLP